MITNRMNMSYSDVWKVYLERAKKTVNNFQELTQLCDMVLGSMGHMQDRLLNAVKTRWGEKELPPYQKFVSIYFIRNITYLRSAYLLACGSFCEPSRDLHRTITETIMRGYLFIVNRNEANLMDSLIGGTMKLKDRELLRKRNYWPFKFLLGELYTKETREHYKKLLGQLSRSSHPSIMGAFGGLEYSSQGVRDCLGMILMMSYGNIQMMAEGFFGLLDDGFKGVIGNIMEKIADSQGVIPVYEPDRRSYSQKIKLKKGNFIKIL